MLYLILKNRTLIWATRKNKIFDFDIVLKKMRAGTLTLVDLFRMPIDFKQTTTPIPVFFARQRASLLESLYLQNFAMRGARMQACR